MPFGLLVWSTGLAPNPLVESIAEARKDPKTKGCVGYSPGRARQLTSRAAASLITNDQCQVIMGPTGHADPDVYAIGDAATIADAPLPATAQGARHALLLPQRPAR